MRNWVLSNLWQRPSVEMGQSWIQGKDKVVVYHPDVKDPDEVRYAWDSNPVKANLYNKAGLPTSVFSTKD